jgi:ATP-dependent DNA ligase
MPRHRAQTLASLLSRASLGLRFNEHMEEQDGPLVFQHACKLGLEGIVSKLKDSRYRSGRSPDWIKSKNPNAPAVRREAEEDWGVVVRRRETFRPVTMGHIRGHGCRDLLIYCASGRCSFGHECR